MSNKTAKKFLAMLITIVLCIALFPFGASAISLDTKGSITISVYSRESKKPVNGAVFRVYPFASAYADGNGISFAYTDEFEKNGMDMGDFSDAYLSVHLMTYAYENALVYTEKVSDDKGEVVFDNLPCGAYLVVPAGIKNGYLNPSPFIVAVPTKDETKNLWIYNIDATPKVESDRDEEDEKTYISVKKYWQSSEKTPDSITVSLIKDGAISDSVVLSSNNNWYYKWDNLDKKHSWSVIETDVPEGYKVSYVTSQMTVIITNTNDDYEDETTTTPVETTKPGDTTKPISTTKPEELIDTGQLNWPVPVFSIVGMLLFAVGWLLFNSGKKDEETL